jgi:co-chaperonin GroES (HSP10)
MRSLRHYLVRIPNRFKETIKVGDKELYLDAKFNEFEYRFMEGEVIAIPEKFDFPVKKGDTLYFHHHVVMNPPQVIDKSRDIYYVTINEAEPILSQAYAFKCAETGDIVPLQNWVFLKPVEQEKEMKSDILHIYRTEEEPNKEGEVAFDSEALTDMGLKKGDRVFFQKDADYEMEIDGNKYWRMNTSFLTYAKVHND